MNTRQIRTPPNPYKQPKDNMQEEINLTDLSVVIYKENKRKGLWQSCNIGEKIALIHSELSEALEACRKYGDTRDEHLPHLPSFDVELADVIIRILDLCGRAEIPIHDTIRQKLEYNKSRPHKHGKAF